MRIREKRTGRLFLFGVLTFFLLGKAAEPPGNAAESPGADLVVDFSLTNGVIRPLHGGNNAPLCSGEIVDLTAFHRELGIPITRLHDSAWPYPDIVDVHAIFPNFDANADSPGSYRFGPTDDYIRAITNAGSRIVFRLGESIEHAKRKRYVHPPADIHKWTQICLGIIRHYNEGWADGHRMGIEYWEIWNEPENRPAMWTGTPAEYYALYSTTAKMIKARWPALKVGGPSLGHQGEFIKGRLQPSEFLRGFIDQVRRQRAPLDFFSWHGYREHAGDYVQRARAIREFLDSEGFGQSESHLNEWNYLPDHDWAPMIASQGPARERWYERQGGAEGAAFAAAVLIGLQRAPVDVANYYSADNQPFGLFTLHGTPKKTFYAFRAFRAMLETPIRVGADEPYAGGTWWMGGLNVARNKSAILVAIPKGAKSIETLRVSGLPWTSPTFVEVHVMNSEHDFALDSAERRAGANFLLSLKLAVPSVALVRLKPAMD